MAPLEQEIFEMTDFILYSGEPTEAFLAAIEAANITVRGWAIFSSRFKNRRQTFKIAPNRWIVPNAKYGDLKLTVERDHHLAWHEVLEIAEAHGVDVHNGMCTLDH